MKILGIAGSPRRPEVSGVHSLVKTVLEASGIEYELVSLYGKRVHGCIGCLGCVHDNVCVVKDDMEPLRQKFIEADAFVIGAPNYYSGINGVTHAVLERWYQFRHREGNLLWGKLCVAVGTGGAAGQAAVNDIEKFCMYSFIETVAKVHGQGAALCWRCGYGETCKVGIPYFLLGPNVKITEDLIPSVSKQPSLLQAARDAGERLGRRLRSGHDRGTVTQRMQAALMAKFKEST
jgi:multimeric flavodoxin WrbA